MSRRSKPLPVPGGGAALPQLVADEQVARDPFDLFAVHEEEAAPPALEFEEPRRLGVDVRVQVVVLVPERVGRVQVLEVLDQIGAVEDAGAQIGGERGEPGAAQRAAGVAHRVVAFAFGPRAAPVRHRRAVDHDRAGVVRTGGRHHHRRPAALAVADDRRLRALRMQLAHAVHELLLRRAHVEQRLAGFRLAEEDDEVDRVAFAQRHADLRIVLEAADPGTMTGARIDDDVRAPLRIHRHALRRQDPHQRVVDRTLELAPVQHDLVVEVQQRRLAAALVLAVVVAALAQRVPEQDRPLREIHRVVVALGPEFPRRLRVGHQVGHVVVPRARHPIAIMLLGDFRAPLEELGDLGRDVVAALRLLDGVHEGASKNGGLQLLHVPMDRINLPSIGGCRGDFALSIASGANAPASQLATVPDSL